MTQVRVDERLRIESERDDALRSTEYVIVTYDREGNEVMGFHFYVGDDSRIQQVSPPMELVEGEDIV